MTGGQFTSILFDAHDGDVSGLPEPVSFRDLNLDQVVASIVAGRDEYDLVPLFHAPLRDEDAVSYRHEVFRDLEAKGLREAVRSFARQMQRVRRFLVLATKQHHALEKQRWFLDAAATYCAAVTELAGALAELDPASRGFRRLRDFLLGYTGSESFASLVSEQRAVREGLDAVRYTLRIKGARVTVARYEEEADYGAEVEETFARFRQGEAAERTSGVSDAGSMNHVEARIAQLVARLHPREFRALADFCAGHRGFLDPTVARFDREVQFYLACIEHVEQLTAAGLPFCYPTVSVDSWEVEAADAFDLALAAKLALTGSTVVRNGFFLRGPERILVVTGPNQGGKTTFARTFGQLHYLAGLGVPVAARSARLFLADRIFTHFEREEHISTLRGKLDDELVRVHEILKQASAESVVVLNEIFASTTPADAVLLGTEVLGRLGELGCLAVCVTFLDELSSLNETTASMVAMVDPDDPSRRTFEVVRRPADGRAFAWAIAGKYGLSYDRLSTRLAR
jgi:DNA mismatch repair protein MutS